MNSKDLELNSYIMHKTNITYLLSDNIDELLDNSDNNLYKDDIFVNDVLDILTNIVEEQIYPEIFIKNIKKLASKVDKKNSLFPIIKEKLSKLKNIKPSNEYLMQEFNDRFVDVIGTYKYSDELVINSIKSDYITIFNLVDNQMEPTKNPYFVFSIKKMLIENYEMFYDKRINEKAIEILDENIEQYQAKKLRKMISNIDKKEILFFEPIRFISLYYYAVIQNAMANKTNIKDLIYGENLNTLEYIEALTYTIIDQELIFSDAAKECIEDIMFHLRNYYMDNKNKDDYRMFNAEYNSHLGKLNTSNINALNFYSSEYSSRIKGTDKLKYYLRPLSVEELLKNDLELLDLYMADKETFDNNKEEFRNKKRLYLSINKFVTLCPSMFLDETVYERTLELLGKHSKNKQLRKQIKKNYK